MKFKTCLLLIALSLFSSFAKADEISYRAVAEELLILTNADKMLKPMLKQMETMMEKQFVQMDAPEELKPVLKKYTGKMVKLMEEELGWAKMKKDYIDVYVKTYSEEELRAIAEFYKSSSGKTFIEKMPKLMKESMEISQKNIPAFMKKMQKMSKEMTSEIKELKEQENEKEQEKE